MITMKLSFVTNYWILLLSLGYGKAQFKITKITIRQTKNFIYVDCLKSRIFFVCCKNAEYISFSMERRSH